MFEDTLVESSGKVGMKKGRTVAVSALLHAGLIAVLIFLPLVFTNSIEGARLRSFLVAPPPPPASQPASNPIPSIVRHAAASSPATAVAPSTTTATIAPIEVPQDIPYIVDLLPSGPFAEGGPTGTRIGVPNGVEGLQPVPFHVVIPPPPPQPPPRRDWRDRPPAPRPSREPLKATSSMGADRSQKWNARER